MATSATFHSKRFISDTKRCPLNRNLLQILDEKEFRIYLDKNSGKYFLFAKFLFHAKKTLTIETPNLLKILHYSK